MSLKPDLENFFKGSKVIVVTANGNFNNLDRFLAKMRAGEMYRNLNRYGMEGVEALANNTPLDSGKTAGSWRYEVDISKAKATITWFNTNINSGVPIAIILQYGHGTGTGGYVSGRDYINPAMRPVFDRIANDVWKAVTTS